MKEYLQGVMSGDIVFWEEEDVHEQILVWKIKKNTPKKDIGELRAQDIGDEERKSQKDNIDTSKNQLLSQNMITELRNRVKSKIDQYKKDSNKLYDVLMILSDKYSDVLEEIDQLL